MKITEAKFINSTKKPVFYRYNTEVTASVGPATVGFIYQRATKDKNTVPGIPENGLMLTAHYDWILSYSTRVKASGRLGVFSGTNPAQPLYGADTDLQLNFVWFNAQGIGWVANGSFFPSAYFGGIINKYGRFQGIAGVGNWWKGIGSYITVFHSFNGVVDPFNPGTNGDIKFANLQNSGISLSSSVDVSNFKFWIKKNIPIKNSGNDLSFTVEYSYYFGKARW